MGKKMLLRKVENKARRISSFGEYCLILPKDLWICHHHAEGHGLLSGDMQESLYYTVYKPSDNHLVFSSDSQPRRVTATAVVEYNTVAVGDRFSNIFVNCWIPRCPTQ
jgi:splicing factor 3B subunit 3